MSQYAIRRAVPTFVMTLGILHLFGGGIGLIMSVYELAVQVAGMSGNPFGPAPGQPVADSMAQALENIQGYRAVATASIVWALALDVVLIVAGIGLLYLRPWGRFLSLVYAPLSLLLHLLMIVWTIGFVLPVMNEAIEAIGRVDPILGSIVAMSRMRPIFGVVWDTALLIYPVVVLALLVPPSAARVFRVEPPAAMDRAVEAGWGAVPRTGGAGEYTPGAEGPDDQRIQPGRP